MGWTGTSFKMIHSIAIAIFLSALGQTAPLTAQPPIVVPGGAGGFDFMGFDARNRLVLASHPRRSGFAVVNLSNGEVKEVDAVAVNGIAADSQGKKVYAAGPDKTLVAYDSTTWNKVGSLALDGPGDCVQFDAKRGVLYVDNDDGTRLWVVNPKTMAVINTISIKEAPEYMEVDNGRNLIFQAIKSTNSVQVVDLGSLKVVDEWSLGDVKSPHGLAVDRRAGKVFVAGKNGKLVVLDAKNGKILQTLDVSTNSDQIAYDSGLKRVYCPGNGVMTVIQMADSGARLLESVTIPKACHSITVDQKTHDVWVAYADEKDSFVMKLVATP